MSKNPSLSAEASAKAEIRISMINFFRHCPAVAKLWRALVENKGVEPLTSCVQSMRSSQLS